MGIIDLNQEAVNLMRQSMFPESLACLKEALIQLRDDREMVDTFTTELSQEQQKDTAASSGQRLLQVRAVRLDLVGAASGVGGAWSNDSSFPPQNSMVYRGAFLLEGCPEDDLLSRHNRDRALSAILYNIGLLHHVGLAGHRSKSKRRKVALKFYTAASKALIDCPSYSPITDALIGLAIVNNQGLIHASFVSSRSSSSSRRCSWDGYESSLFADILWDMIQNLPADEVRVLESELRHFRRSAVRLQEQNAAAAAA